MSIFLVRHGETAFNRDGQGLGQEDVELTEVGRAQAAAVARRLADAGVRRVITSPLSRAAEVADAIAREHGLTAERMAALAELDIGETEGLDFAEMRRRFPEFLVAWAGPEGWRARMPGGESMEDLAMRLQPVVEVLRGDADGDTVLVSHNFVLRTLLCMLLGIEIAAWRSFQVDLASVTCMNVRSGRVGVAFVNDRCHLVNLNLA